MSAASWVREYVIDRVSVLDGGHLYVYVGNVGRILRLA
jgi:hypothetical protein